MSCSFPGINTDRVSSWSVWLPKLRKINNKCEYNEYESFICYKITNYNYSKTTCTAYVKKFASPCFITAEKFDNDAKHLN